MSQHWESTEPKWLLGFFKISFPSFVCAITGLEPSRSNSGSRKWCGTGLGVTNVSQMSSWGELGAQGAPGESQPHLPGQGRGCWKPLGMRRDGDTQRRVNGMGKAWLGLRGVSTLSDSGINSGPILALSMVFEGLISRDSFSQPCPAPCKNPSHKWYQSASADLFLCPLPLSMTKNLSPLHKGGQQTPHCSQSITAAQLSHSRCGDKIAF